ncbi:MAG TPA: Csp1 family four helix bundle copper storage protein [Polyangia bacterium]|jgi:Cys-rich four helix bundle protein (predicted Tat secretion target)|nr:Csp1 family four helix bundle copper storage protein [Polyangia bacterium]
MRRRAFLAAGAGILAAATSLKAHAAPSKSTAGGGAMSGVADAAGDCVRKGEACLQHCLTMLATGDQSMAACSKTVRDMLATSRALETLAVTNGPRAVALAKVAAEVARDCQAECAKHAQHPPCKECGDACGRLIAAVARLG